MAKYGHVREGGKVGRSDATPIILFFSLWKHFWKVLSKVWLEWHGITPFYFPALMKWWLLVLPLISCYYFNLKFESSAFAFVCFEISTLLKLENSCLLLFSEGLKFQALEGLKFQDKQTQKQMIRPIVFFIYKRGN